MPSILSTTVSRVAVLLTLAVVLAGVGLLVAKRTGGLPDDAAFAVGDSVVSTTEVTRRMKALQALYGVQPPEATGKTDAFRRDTTKSMAVQLLMDRAAKKLDIVVADKNVDDAMSRLIEDRYPDGGRDAYLRALGEKGASEAQVRDEVRQQLLVARLFEELTSDIAVTDDEVREAFEERRDELGGVEQRTLRNIVVLTKADARRVISALQAGVPFVQAAKRSSLDGATRTKGGLLGDVAASQLEASYSKAAFATGPGQVFGPVRTESGWNVGLVEQILPPKPMTFAEVQEALKAALVQEESVQVWTEWLRDLLRDGDVEYAETYRPKDPLSVPTLDASSPAGSR